MIRTNLNKPCLTILFLAIALFGLAGTAKSQAKKPNILVIMTDDVGVWNIGAFHRGMTGGRTWLDECYFRGRLEDGAHDLSICEP